MKNKKVLIGVLCGIGALLIIGLAAVAAFLIIIPNLFGKAQVATATINTIEGFNDNNRLMKAIDITDIVKGNQYTINMDIDTEISSVGDVSVNLVSQRDNNKIDVAGDVDVSVIPNIEFDVQYIDGVLKAYVPMLNNYVFTYDHNANNNGYLKSDYPEEMEIIDEALEELDKSLEGEPVEFKAKDLSDIFKLDKIEFERTKEKKEFTINDKNIKLKGYYVELDENYFNEVLDNYVEYLKANVGEDSLTFGEYSIDELADELRNELDGMDEVEVTFYIYKKELAGIDVESGREEINLVFKGGDYRAQNIDVYYNDVKEMSLEGKISSGVETASVTVEDFEYFSYKYDTNDDVLKVTVDTDYETYSLEMDIVRSKDSLYIDTDYLDLGDAYIGGTFEFKKGSSIKPISEGTEFDVGTADLDDFNNLSDELQDIAMELLF